jgi:hypothetical protein
MSPTLPGERDEQFTFAETIAALKKLHRLASVYSWFSSIQGLILRGRQE